MKIDQKKLDFLNQHSRPVTRRDFVSKGLVAAGGMMMAPSLLSLLTRSALADGTDSLGAVSPRFITFDLSGGAALMGNFLVGGKGGPQDLLPRYDLLGWNPRATGAIDSTFGLPMAAGGVSQILAGIQQVASADAQSRFKMASLLHTGDIDTDSNPLSILSLVQASRVSVGSAFDSALGLRLTPSGGRSKPLMDLASNRAYYVQDYNGVTNCVGLGAKFGNLKPGERFRIATLLKKLTHVQLNAALGSTLNPASYDYLKSAVSTVPDQSEPLQGLDPRQNALFSQLYNVNANTGITEVALLRASLVMGTLTGQLGPSVITIDGCDYHDNTSATGDAKDLEIGREIGRAIEAARSLKVPLFIHIITDGGIYPTQGSRVWVGDSPETCMSVIGLYRPDQAPVYRSQSSMQIGAYTSEQTVDRSSVIGASAAVAANVALANFLSVSGQLKSIGDLYPNSLSVRELDPLLVFA